MDRTLVLAYARDYCNYDWPDEGGFSLVVDKLTESVSRAGITSESLSDMSQSFGDNGDINVKRLLAPYRKMNIV